MPLLPEYLSQPIHVAVQSSSTDWIALVAGGVFTLLGALAGAWLGAKGAYASSVKAHRRELRIQKLEEAIHLIDRERKKALNYLNLYAPNILSNEPEAVTAELRKNYPIRDDSYKFLLMSIRHYCPNLREEMEELDDFLIEVEIKIFPLVTENSGWGDFKDIHTAFRRSLAHLVQRYMSLNKKASSELTRLAN